MISLREKQSQTVVAHPSTREVETGVIWLGRERNIRREGMGLRVQSEDWQRQDIPFSLRIS